MIFLVLSIIAAIILVGIAIRPPPSLRTHRPGLEISTPKPYIGGGSWWQMTWLRFVDWLKNIRERAKYMFTRPSLPQIPPIFSRGNTGSHGDSQVGRTAHPDGTFSDEKPFDNSSNDVASADHPFWTDESSGDTTDLPVKGLVTR